MGRSWSIRARIALLSLLLILMLIAAALYIQELTDESSRRSRELTAHQQAFSKELGALKSTLYLTESGLYQYAVLMDESQRAAVERAVRDATQHALRLSESRLVVRDDRLRPLVSSILVKVHQLKKDGTKLLRTIADPRVRFPASVIVTDSLYPTNLRFSTAVEDAISDLETSPKSPLHDRLTELLYQVRYYWARQTNAVRMFIANRAGIFGTYHSAMRQRLVNRGYYARAIDQDITRLESLEKKNDISLRVATSVKAMREAASDYDRHLQDLINAFETDSWRRDIPLFRKQMQPLLRDIWNDVRAVEDRLSGLSSDTLLSSVTTTDKVSYFLWFITALSILFLLLLFLSYEYVIRRPIAQVTGALQALSRGTSYTLLPKTHAAETERMLNAFREMQGEVQSREMRLRAILDNASEGIITVSSEGIIETFNTAAQNLFGYSADEAIGQNVNILMPQPMRHEHDQHIRRYLGTGDKRLVGTELNVNARRRDGTVFPISIKLSELTLDGQRYFTAIVSDISERKAMMDNLRRLAEHDSLTQLFNRQYFLQELDRVVSKSSKGGERSCALLYIDLDNFKFVNDTLGHLAGDKVLVEVGRLILKHSRKDDVIARLGGDEFALLLFNVPDRQALDMADDYRRLMVDYAFHHEGRTIDIGCSIGVAMLTRDVLTKEDLMSRADLSCHMAKRAGRNCVHLYGADDQRNLEDMSADMSWARNIKRAIEHNRFDFALQPIVDLKSETLVASEVLLRMLEPDGQVIMPAGFLPSAERFGLMLDVDRWVIAHAIDLLSLRGNPDERFAVNLSAMSIAEKGLLDHITGLLAFHEIDPRRLTFEITETVAISDLPAAIGLLERLRALGCKTALDDFGAGYSSFAYLKDLPVDYVKIDGSFVRNIDQDPLHRAMVKSMNEIAHAMGKQTVAEFVDSVRAVACLREIGVDHVQGYYIGRPKLVGYPDMGRDGTLCQAAAQ